MPDVFNPATVSLHAGGARVSTPCHSFLPQVACFSGPGSTVSTCGTPVLSRTTTPASTPTPSPPSSPGVSTTSLYPRAHAPGRPKAVATAPQLVAADSHPVAPVGGARTAGTRPEAHHPAISAATAASGPTTEEAPAPAAEGVCAGMEGGGGGRIRTREEAREGEEARSEPRKMHTHKKGRFMVVSPLHLQPVFAG